MKGVMFTLKGVTEIIDQLYSANEILLKNL